MSTCTQVDCIAMRRAFRGESRHIWTLALSLLISSAGGAVHAGTYIYGFAEDGATPPLPAGFMTRPPAGPTDGLVLDGTFSDVSAAAAGAGHAVFGSLASSSRAGEIGGFQGDLAGRGLGGGVGSKGNGGGFVSPSSPPHLSLAEPTPFEPGSGQSYLPDPLGETPNTEIPRLGEYTPPPYAPPQTVLVDEDDPSTVPGATIIDPAAVHDGTDHLPEPGTLSLLILGVLALGWHSIRTRRNA
jgi:hypothetical protein